MNQPEHWPTPEMWNAFENATGERVAFSTFEKGLKAALSAAPTPEVEPIYQARMLGMERHSISKQHLWVDIDWDEYAEDSHEGERPTRVLYTHPAPPSELVKEAEILVEHCETGGAVFDGEKHFDNFRDALNKYKCPAPAQK